MLSGFLGLVVGSALTSVVERVPAQLAMLNPGPRCATCAAPLSAWESLPLVSWLVLRGRCAHCGHGISPRYPAIEVLTAGLFVGVALRFGLQPAVFPYWLLAATLVAISAIDLEHHIVPNRIVYPVLAVTLPLLVAVSLADGTPFALASAAIGGLAGFGALFVIHLIQPQGMGFGDVRLAGLIGIYLGWLSLGSVAAGLVLGFVAAAMAGLGLMAAGKAGRKSKVAFGPFLALGAMVVVYWGNPILALWGP